MLNIDETNQFAIIWDIYDRPNSQFVYGTVVFAVGRNLELMPKFIDSHTTLQVVFSNLKDSFLNPYYPGGLDNVELGDIDIDYYKMDCGETPSILSIECTELGDIRGKYSGGVSLFLGYAGNYERLFYSKNGGKSYKEIRLPRNTVENVIMSLPDEDELNLLRKKGNSLSGTNVIKAT